MAGDSKKVQPIIIKRIKKGGHAAHGGAWKIAYADFVTAMMAFFLLMWLLGSTTEGDKKGIADYFNSPLKVAFFGGSGAGDATSLVKGGGNNLSESVGQVKKGKSETAEEKARKKAIRAEQAKAEAERLRVLKQKVEEVIANDERLSKYKTQIQLDLTAEGLRILAVLLNPITPKATAKLWAALGSGLGELDAQPLNEAAAWGQLKPGSVLNILEPLFPRIETDSESK